MPVKIGLILIATGGERYTKFVEPLVKSAQEFFPSHDTILFTDDEQFYRLSDMGVIAVQHEDLGWPRATLLRYHVMLKCKELLEKYDYLFYLDCDMVMTSKIGPEEILADGLTAILHGGFPDSFERRAESTACVPEDYHGIYYQGCLIGGRTKDFLTMCEDLSYNIDIDERNGVMAIWHDESHLNKYLIDHPPAKTLTPAFAYPAEHYLKHPESWRPCNHEFFIPKIRHLEKEKQGEWKNG